MANLSKKELDKLMDIATSSKEPIVYEKEDNPEVKKFIDEVGIEAGDTKVDTVFIYYLYFIWKSGKANARQKVRRLEFLKIFEKHFEKTKSAYSVAFLLNPEPFDLSPEGYFAARAQLRRERNVNKNKRQGVYKRKKKKKSV